MQLQLATDLFSFDYFLVLGRYHGNRLVLAGHDIREVGVVEDVSRHYRLLEERVEKVLVHF